MLKNVPFRLSSEFEPKGDQPQAIEALTQSIRLGNKYQTLLGVTGSGKTFTMANVIQRLQRPTLIISHNKTLAAQLYSEFKTFFPDNAVEYFVSYYDYYQPEAYIPQTDTYIEKDASVNEEIDRLRISATSSLISRKDVIVVASVSCIYGLGSPEDFTDLMIPLKRGETLRRDHFLERLVENLYVRNDAALIRGNFRVRGEIVDVMPAYMETAVRIEFWGDTIESIQEFDPETGEYSDPIDSFQIYPANQFITRRDKLEGALESIREELDTRVTQLEKADKLIEAQRLRMRTEYDLELMREMGFCSGIENYSRHLSGRQENDRPSCLIDFFPKDFLLILDESHVTVPQIGGMYFGDRSRKQRLVEYGFRLPSAMDNRPLRIEEFWSIAHQTLFVSATPSKHEFEVSSVIAEQLIRPTGLLDPIMDVRPAKGQVEDMIGEIHKAVAEKERVLVTTLTKRMSEDITLFLRKAGIRVEYLHSDIDAIERVEILRNLRRGEFDVLVGVNLLREGLDLPEVALVAILDADKEGFLRSQTSLIQTAGRAARHEKGRVLLYADKMTNSLKNTLEITHYRREKQEAYNREHGITPRGVRRKLDDSLQVIDSQIEKDPILLSDAHGDRDLAAVLAQLETEMLDAARELNFEQAAVIRNQINTLKTGTPIKPNTKKPRN
ncbi:MAG: excinuclease ABC subunit B [Verrucomicrobia bacterium CG_4_10_14_3_um_filter_43_23]|nr:MAG: excinuclease ABC subunit B [Verrucomicrobia bacterium CG1_02_43_26]PIP58620.1 MAG: excinuclease ABC subunit B [Verrucomicrobia bacterium CG22_combo_CG10-13_8_21_14_all_43_17]PIX58376.1 MAG: excinuclease ABC subunit B [Verrucomicrobia bacterium CG_4_10_14_3_um_filter_43_23]PIY61214.1 MAG: excinuclease ABC subunit B [Verrucomicrobia bacterium CG_4_10_14_0_8_um_filter_43_34]PJA44971.1 MAG: excinuclease ABC subunit B [Verrucomicrobia bacterium CG_4_9_14_3_um_filter_43_20]